MPLFGSWFSRYVIAAVLVSTSICSFHHCYSCLPRLQENHLYVQHLFSPGNFTAFAVSVQ